MHPARHPSRHPAHRAMGWPLAVLLLCGVGAGCSHSGEGDEVTQKTAQVVAVNGTDLHRVILDPQAVQRLGITTQRVPPRTASSQPPHHRRYRCTWAAAGTDRSGE